MEEKNQEISDQYECKIAELENYIEIQYENLNMEAIWLFVATLGSWSVTNIYMKIIAILIIFFLFAFKAFENRSDKRPFKKMFTSLRKEIEDSVISGDHRKARFYDVDMAEKKLLSFKSNFILTPRFFLCYLFWAASFFVFVSQAIK